MRDADTFLRWFGVEAREKRNHAIYQHWGYNQLVLSQVEEGAQVLYYKKALGFGG